MTSATTRDASTIVVTGATGKVGSRLIHQLLQKEDNDVKVIALVRNVTKAHDMFSMYTDVQIRHADFENISELKEAFQSIPTNYSLFLACGNVANQATVEGNVARAAAASSSCLFCVKLSTAQPLVEQSIGHGVIHLSIEKELSSLFASDNVVDDESTKKRYCILRPHMFVQMLDPSIGGPLMGIHLEDSDTAGRHVLAEKNMSIIDCNDVASCAKSILLLSQKQRVEQHGGMIHELTGPESIVISKQVATIISKLRPSPISITACDLNNLGMPAPVTEQLTPFVTALGTYNKVTNTVQEITGHPATSIHTTLLQNHVKAFLPQTFRRLVATGQADSFREAANIATEDLMTCLVDTMDDDEILIRVQSAGVNGGADTFGVTRAAADAKNFPLGNEGTGIVVLCGKDVTNFQSLDTAVFVGSGAYGEYVKVKASRCSNIATEKATAPSELTALRISALTAFVALTRTCPVKPTDVVLVSACCGGTGHFAVQVAKNAGATVIGTVGSTIKVPVAQSLGCVDRIVDLSKEDLSKVLQSEFPNGINVCYEGVGGKVLRDVYQNLSTDGTILIVGSISQYPHNALTDDCIIDELKDDVMEIFRSGKTVKLSRGRTIVGNVWGDLFQSNELANYRDLVFDLYAQDKLQVLLDNKNEFIGVDSVCDAVDHMLSRKSIGKVCVTISN